MIEERLEPAPAHAPDEEGAQVLDDLEDAPASGRGSSTRARTASRTSQPLAMRTMPPTATVASGRSMKGFTTRRSAFSSMMESASMAQNSG